MVPTPYGLPLIRLCARMAVPADPINDKSADDGYVVDQHLDFEGYLVDDNPLSNGGYDENGVARSKPNPDLQVPKICMYWDPSLLDTLMSWGLIAQYGLIMIPVIVGLSQIPGLDVDAENVLNGLLNPDLMDYNPVQESNHRSSGLNPVFQMIIDLMQSQADIETAFANMIDKLPDYIKYSMYWLIQMEWLLKASVWIIENVSIEVVKFIGTLNRVVVASFGCVTVPLGPFPPPYCNPLPKNISIPSVFPICTTTVLNDGTPMLQDSTTQDPCKVGNIACTAPIPFGPCMNPSEKGERNNAIHNLIRVGFTDNKPLCKAPASTVDGKCVNINGALNASALHANNNNSGIIKLCTQIPAKAGETPCVESTYLLNQCTSNGATRPWFCDNGLRVLYSIGSADSSTEYYDESLPDCPTANRHCQTTWGVNIGSFADISVAFPQRDDKEDPKWSASVILPDSNKNQHTFQAAITRTESTVGASAMTPQEPDQICVYEKNVEGNYISVGCNSRAVAPKPKVRDCAVGGWCTSSFRDPRMIIKLEVPGGNDNSDFTEGYIGTSTSVNLAGYNYESYATDKTFVKKPFSGSKAILNGSSIYGNYLNDIAPYSVRGDVNSNAVYLDGVEYLNGLYQVGAQYLCLTGHKSDDCASGQTRQNCVLATLLNSDVISCYAFKGIIAKYSSIDVCNPNNTNLTCNYNAPKESYDGKNNNKVNIIPCVSNTSGLTTYCYDYGAQNGPLCAVSEGGVGRIVPNTNSDVLPNGLRPNIDYYNYTPGVASASNTRTFSNVQANATIVQTVIQKTKEVFASAIAFQYSRDICTPASTPFYTNDMIKACTDARTTSAKLSAICTQTQALVTNKASTLYLQLSNVCTAAQTNMNNILKDQYNTQLLSQMQSDSAAATTEISNLMSVIKNFSNIPTLVTNIVKAEETIYKSADNSTYPTPLSKINAICTQTQSFITDRLTSPMIYDALSSACTTAKGTASQAGLDALHKIISGDPLNNAIVGFAQYNIANDGGRTLSANNIAKQTVPGDYIAPDFETMIVRNRTDLENGLCVSVPPPSCTAISPANIGTGYATWSKVNMGQKSIGTCMAGTFPKSPTSLERHCLFNKANNTASLEPITPAMGCNLKCSITFGKATATRDDLHTSGDFRNGMTNPKNWNSSDGNGSYSASGPDANGNYTISFTTNELRASEWDRNTNIVIPVTYKAGLVSNPTVKFNSISGSPEYYLNEVQNAKTLKSGANNFRVYFWTRHGGSHNGNGNVTITINCNDK